MYISLDLKAPGTGFYSDPRGNKNRRDFFLSMSQLQFGARQRRGIQSSGNGYSMFRQSEDLRKIAVEKRALVHKIDCDDVKHWGAVMKFLQDDPAGPKLSLSVDGCGIEI